MRQQGSAISTAMNWIFNYVSKNDRDMVNRKVLH